MIAGIYQILNLQGKEFSNMISFNAHNIYKQVNIIPVLRRKRIKTLGVLYPNQTPKERWSPELALSSFETEHFLVTTFLL